MWSIKHRALLALISIALPTTTRATTSVPYQVVYSFTGGNDGAYPFSQLIYHNGMMISTTFRGGGENGGAVFGWNLKTNQLNVLHAFSGGSDGANPYSGVIAVGGTLYGATFVGGLNQCASDTSCGVVYSLKIHKKTEQVLHDFGGVSVGDGAQPQANLTYFGGLLYGTTYDGGTQNCGTVFSLSPQTAVTTTIYSFRCGSDGSYPFSRLVPLGGLLYGTAFEGGDDGYGLVFALNPASNTVTTVRSFTAGTDGRNPIGDMIVVNGNLVGTTEIGGAGLGGAVFSLNPETDEETIIYSFQQNNGGYFPQAGVTAFKGKLYGTTFRGGAANLGTVFVIDPKAGTATVLHSFLGQSDGMWPASALTNVDGVLYGATPYGGCTNCGEGFGTLYRVSP